MGGTLQTAESKQQENTNNALRICSVSNVDNFFMSNPDPTPWFSLYQKRFLSTLRFNDYEFLDAPIQLTHLRNQKKQKHTQQQQQQITGTLQTAESKQQENTNNALRICSVSDVDNFF